MKTWLIICICLFVGTLHAQTVTVTVVSGDNITVPESVSVVNGSVTLPAASLVCGTVAGPYEISIAADVDGDGVDESVSVTGTCEAGPAKSLVVKSGDNQIGTAGLPLQEDIVVHFADEFGNSLAILELFKRLLMGSVKWASIH